jgi:hypothetical protein
MKTLIRNLLFFILFFLSGLVNAQDLEEFKDTNLLRNGQWMGQ